MTLWNPNNIPEAQRIAWYDARDAASITFNGGNVAQINDKWGSGSNQVQATAANQPVYNATGLNGRPALASDDATRWMQAIFGSSLSLSQARFYAVFSRPGGSNRLWSVAHQVSGIPFFRGANGGLFTGFRSGGAIFNSPSISLGNTATVVVYGFSLAEVFAAMNGGPILSNAVTGSQALSADAFSLFTDARTPGVVINQGRFGEGILVTGEPIPNEYNLMTGYLAWGWGLQNLLPSNHPFRNGAPDEVQGGMAVSAAVNAASSGDVINVGSIAASAAVSVSADADIIIEGAMAASVTVEAAIEGGLLTSVRPRHRFVVPPTLSQAALRAGARPAGGLAGYSFTAEAKDPDAISDYEIDWGEWLGQDETLVQPARITATGGITINFVRIEEGRYIRWRVRGGVAGSDAFMTVTIATTSGQSDERTIRLPVRER
ncbi:MAG: hypothetical protein ACK4IS_07385 [Erythrobacter sp.]